jgi:hypothetical protein
MIVGTTGAATCFLRAVGLQVMPDLRYSSTVYFNHHANGKFILISIDYR